MVWEDVAWEGVAWKANFRYADAMPCRQLILRQFGMDQPRTNRHAMRVIAPAAGLDCETSSGSTGARRHLPGVGTIALLALLCACSSSGGNSQVPSPTLVTVSPNTFGKGVLCGDIEGAWRSYVATLTDVTDPDKPFVLASSNPSTCIMPISFSWVIPGHKYVADIDGYEQHHSKLVSYGGVSSGSRHVVEAATGVEIAPRWQASCGRGDGEGDITPTTSFLRSNVMVRDCDPLMELYPGSVETGITVDLSTTRGSLLCGDGPGQVDRLVVTPQDPSLAVVEASCDATLTFAPVAADKNHKFFVEAFEAGSSLPTWATHCERRAIDGVVLSASCDLLSSQGAMRIDIGSILSKLERTCSEQDIVSYTAAVVGTSLSSGIKSCASSTVFTGLAPASYQVLVDAFDSSGLERLNAFCEGVVRVGATVDAVCQVRSSD